MSHLSTTELVGSACAARFAKSGGGHIDRVETLHTELTQPMPRLLVALCGIPVAKAALGERVSRRQSAQAPGSAEACAIASASVLYSL